MRLVYLRFDKVQAWDFRTWLTSGANISQCLGKVFAFLFLNVGNVSHPLCGVWTCESKAFATIVKYLITHLQIEFTDKTAGGKNNH